MQIVCDQCGKKYKTREQKTKPFKIRCTQCPNVFIVDPTQQAQGGDEATRQVSSAMASALQQGAGASAGAVAQQAPAPSVEWYAVIQGQQSGPFSLAQLQEAWAQGQLNEQSYVWRDGMAGWELITGVTELSSITQPASAPVATSSPTPTPAQQPAQQPTQEPAAHVQSTQSTPSQDHLMSSSSASAPLGLREEASTPDRSASAPQVERYTSQAEPQPSVEAHEAPAREPSAVLTTAQLKNQRNENSVLFSLDAIDALGAAEPERTPQAARASSPAVTNTGGSDGSGLIDISALGSALGESSPSQGGGAGTINLTQGMKRPAMVKRNSSLPLVIASVALTLIVAGGAFLWFYQSRPTPSPQVNKVTLGSPTPTSTGAQAVSSQSTNNATANGAQAETASGASEQAGSADTTSEPSTQVSAQTSAPAPQVKRRPAPKSKQRASRRSSSRSRSQTTRATPRTQRASRKPSRAPKKSTGEASSLLSSLRGGKKPGGAAPSLAVSSSPSRNLPKKPGKSDIVRAMRRVNVSRCASRDPSLKGKAVIDVRIVSSGAVQSANALPPFRNTPVGSCLEREVRKQRVPAFRDANIQFKFPFQI